MKTLLTICICALLCGCGKNDSSLRIAELEARINKMQTNIDIAFKNTDALQAQNDAQNKVLNLIQAQQALNMGIISNQILFDMAAAREISKRQPPAAKLR